MVGLPSVTTRVGIGLGAALAIGVAIMAAAWIVPLPTRLASPPSTVLYFRDGTPAYVFLSPDDKWRVAVTPEEVDADYLRALLRLEDRWFYFHPGIDPLAIVRATFTNVLRQRVVSGGSTLTLQLIRVLEPRPRTLRSKALEALRAMQLELRMSKREILAAYLTFAPFGRNIEGVQAGALAYFGITAAALTPAQIAVLLAVPQAPNARYPAPKNVANLRAARDATAARIARLKGLNLKAGETGASILAEIRKLEVPSTLRPFPRRAPHFAEWMRRKETAIALRSTLDKDIQPLTEQLVANERAEFSRGDIHSVAVVVVDTASGDIRAAVGNFDYWDEAHGGQIAAFDTPRSPGSLLKPVIYAMAIDKGLALPEHLVPDTPVQYGGYAPRNFDEDFRGLVRLDDALSLSLNLPFVNLLRKVGVENFLAFLRRADVKTLQDKPGFYGLSAAIGALEMTPLEAAGLYRALADNGKWRTLRYKQSPLSDTLNLFSPGSAYLTRKALALRDRPDFPGRRQHATVPIDIHWKTGTSFGYHDAWAAGSGGGATVVVWAGNLDNKPSVKLVGAEAAAPLLFDLLEAIGKKHSSQVEVVPPDLTGIEVCAYSGHLASPGCPSTKLIWSTTSHVPVHRCPYHLELDIDVATGLALTPACRVGRDYRTATFLSLPPTVRRWMKARSEGLPEPPSLAPFCDEKIGHGRPLIVSPTPGAAIALIPGLPAKDQEIGLQAESPHPSAKLSWFVDGEYLGNVPADEKVWWLPQPGTHALVVVDEAGLSSRLTVEVTISQ